MNDVKQFLTSYYMDWCHGNRQLLSNKPWSVFIVSQISISSVCESLFAAASRRVAFSREIWRAIYRSLPEHQAWCCCCCFYLSLPLTTPASVSLCLSIFICSLSFYPFHLGSLFSELPFSWHLSLPVFWNSQFSYLCFVACFDVNYWSEQKGGD